MSKIIPLEGLQRVNDYLDTRHYSNIEIDKNLDSVGNIVIAAGFDFSFREILCSLLAGQGLKLPNIQICISLNLKALLSPVFGALGKIQAALTTALTNLNNAFNSFLEHTGIQNVLNRVNNVISEIAGIANMINFCGKPIVPIPIPLSLENSLQSFLGRGMDMINKIGSIIPSQIGGCLDGGGFNGSIFNGGLLYDIWQDYDRVIAGTLTELELDNYVFRINEIVREIQELIDDENNTSSIVDIGGSQFEEPSGEFNFGIGVLHNPNELGMSGNISVAASLRNAYSQLAGYPVVDSDGNVYENIFKLFLEDDLIDLLKRRPTPNKKITRQEPIFNYCGQIVGYNTITDVEGDDERSRGTVPTPSTAPGSLKDNNLTIESLTAPIGSVQTFFDDAVSTTDSSIIEIFKDADINVPTNKTWFFTLNVLGRRTDSTTTENVAKKLEGVAFNTNGTTTVSSDQISETIFVNDDTNYNINITGEGSAIKFTISGIPQKQYNWTFKFSYIEA
jgi:hypothetical protein